MAGVITLTTDFGDRDYYVGAIKGVLYKALGTPSVVDISHNISPFNIQETAYVLKNSYKYFPEKSIHIIGVDTEKNHRVRHLIMFYNEHFFIAADNGVLSLLAENTEKKIEMVEIPHDINTTFSTLRIFCAAAISLHKGYSITEIGQLTTVFLQNKLPSPLISSNKKEIKGIVIHINRYGNAVTNISKKLIKSIGKIENIRVEVNEYSFNRIYENYSEFVNFRAEESISNYEGNKLALYNFNEFLTIAIYRSNVDTVGGASTLLGINNNTVVRVYLN